MGAELKKGEVNIVEIITTVLKIPGVKVNRDELLRERFKGKSEQEIKDILAYGPVAAGCSRKELKEKAYRILNERTAMSTGASFLAGLPGGLAMAAAIPADIVQFFGVAIRLAQELAYLYGEQDLWMDGSLNPGRVQNQLILYLGVMMGATGAVQSVRLISSALAKQVIKKLPQKALTKTFYYPVVKSVAKFLGVKMTKSLFAKGVAKAVPILGGIVSGGITFLSMHPMGEKLIKTFDKANFDYTEEEIRADVEEIVTQFVDEEDDAEIKTGFEEVAAPFAEKEREERPISEEETSKEEDGSSKSVLEKIEHAKALFDAGVLTEDEFQKIKQKLIGML